MSEIRFPIEAGHIMMFARAVGDDNPIYHDAELAKASEVGAIIAPPTFVQSVAQYEPNYPLRPQVGKPWFGSGKTPSGVQANAKDAGNGGTLHAEQHYEYHRTPKAGDVYTVTRKSGKTWEKESPRAGKLMFSEGITEYRDQHGELVVTARSVGVRTERPVDSKKST